jgi:hypothetical protein
LGDDARMSRRTGLWVSGIASAVLLAVLAVLDSIMRDAGGPGIVGFELAGSEEEAAEILADWGEGGQDAARASLYLDFPYLIAYGAFLTLAVAAVSDRARACGLRKLTAIAAVAIVLPASGASFDAIEDIALLVALEGEGGDTAPLLAAVCATLKFVLITAALVYVVVGLIAARRCERSASVS